MNSFLNILATAPCCQFQFFILIIVLNFIVVYNNIFCYERLLNLYYCMDD